MTFPTRLAAELAEPHVCARRECGEPARFAAVAPNLVVYACASHLGQGMLEAGDYVWFVHPLEAR